MEIAGLEVLVRELGSSGREQKDGTRAESFWAEAIQVEAGSDGAPHNLREREDGR